MRKNILWVGVGIAALSIGLIALPSPSATLQEDASTTVKIERLPKVRELRQVQIDGDRISQDVGRALEQSRGVLAEIQALPDAEAQEITVFDGEEGPSWLGVETHEVTADNAKEL